MRKRGRRPQRVVFDNPLSIFTPVPKKTTDAVMLRYLCALESIATGSNPTVEELRDLSDVVNLVETISKSMGKLNYDEVMHQVDAGTEAVVESANRARDGKSVRMSGKGIEAMRVLIDIYRQCLERLSEQEMRMAVNITARRLELLQRQRNPDATVIRI